MGSMVQSNSIAETCNTAFGIPTWIIGLIVATVAAFIFVGGINRIASVTEKMVPLMALLYLAGGLILIIFNIKNLPEAIGMIFKYAFVPQAIIGGGFGAAIKSAISQGAKRGLFSNEAGMGSTPHAHALANVEKPHDQGVTAMIGVFIDTFIVLTMTALIVICTLYAGGGPLAETAAEGAAAHITKANMVQLAFS
jgi:AGCS family alanine or glycine:cation symporter